MDFTAVTPSAAAQLSPAALAFVGDTVFDLFVRTQLVRAMGSDKNAATYPAPGSDTASHVLHASAVRRVNAAAQAKLAERLHPLLTPDEAEIYRRGKNCKLSRVPKSATAAQYHLATALEAVCGYLYLSGQTERLHALLGATL